MHLYHFTHLPHLLGDGAALPLSRPLGSSQQDEAQVQVKWHVLLCPRKLERPGTVPGPGAEMTPPPRAQGVSHRLCFAFVVGARVPAPGGRVPRAL